VPCQPSTGLFHRNGQPVEDCIADNAGEPMDETVARPSTSLTVNEVGAHSTIQKQSKCWHWIWRTATPTAVQTWTNRPTAPRVIDSASNKGYTLLVDSHCFSYCKTLTRGSKVYLAMQPTNEVGRVPGNRYPGWWILPNFQQCLCSQELKLSVCYCDDIGLLEQRLLPDIRR